LDYHHPILGNKKNIKNKKKKTKQKNDKQGFRQLLVSMMNKRLIISGVVLLTFLAIIVGIGLAIYSATDMSEQWKEMLLLLLGAFIGSYGKIIDYWFSDADKDKLLVQKMDEEDGVSLSKVDDKGSITSVEPTVVEEEVLEHPSEQ
jgi:hypothetical protein